MPDHPVSVERGLSSPQHPVRTPGLASIAKCLQAEDAVPGSIGDSSAGFLPSTCCGLEPPPLYEPFSSRASFILLVRPVPRHHAPFMTASEAYLEAQRRIRAAKQTGQHWLDLGDIDHLEEIPEEIGELKGLR